jgi:copper chaperone CopZ/cytochrome c biogenesis protein CcdA
MRQRTFSVDDIHCDGCSSTIADALGRLHGVQDVGANQRTNTVEVTFDPSQIDEGSLVDRLAEAGFPVQHTDAHPPRPAGSDPAGAATRSAWSRYFVLTVAVTVVALAGYGGYELYPRFGLPALEGAGLLILAVGAGVASFFAPCSFPLLVTLLVRQDHPRAGSRSGPAVFATAMAAGAAVFLVLLGALVAIGGSAFAASVTFTSTVGIALRIIVGAALVILGLVQLGVLAGTSFHKVERATKRLSRWQAKVRREHPVAGFTVFGFLYLLAGFG